MSNQQQPKRPRSSSGNGDDQSAVLDKLVEDFQKIAKPEVTDLSNFLVQFLKKSNNLNTRFNTVEDRVTALEERCDQKDTHLQNVEDRVHDIEDNQNSLKKELEEKIAQLSVKVDENSQQSIHNTTQTLCIQQSLMDNDIILKGFPSKPDPDIVLNNFVNFYGINKMSIHEYYHVSYTKHQKVASSQSNEKMLHFIVISFKSKSTKVKVFESKKKKGSPLLKNLIPDSSTPDILIKCANKLTKFNLYAQRILYKSHQQKIISEYRFHNHLFQIKVQEDSNWIRVDTYKQVNDLNQKTMKTQQEN